MQLKSEICYRYFNFLSISHLSHKPSKFTETHRATTSTSMWGLIGDSSKFPKLTHYFNPMDFPRKTKFSIDKQLRVFNLNLMVNKKGIKSIVCLHFLHFHVFSSVFLSTLSRVFLSRKSVTSRAFERELSKASRQNPAQHLGMLGENFLRSFIVKLNINEHGTKSPRCRSLNGFGSYEQKKCDSSQVFPFPLSGRRKIKLKWTTWRIKLKVFYFLNFTIAL